MEFVLRLPLGQIKVEGDTAQELFAALGDAQEVFGESQCGLCKSDHIRFIHRVIDDNHFHEMRCGACGAKLHFGINKKGGGLFPKRKLLKDGPDKGRPDMENGVWDKDGRGWTKWMPQANGK